MASSRSRSKKQSAGSRERPLSLPEDFVLYLDDNLHNCKPILDVLTQRNVKHERHGQHFAAGTEDAVWLPFVGQQRWILLLRVESAKQGVGSRALATFRAASNRKDNVARRFARVDWRELDTILPRLVKGVAVELKAHVAEDLTEPF